MDVVEVLPLLSSVTVMLGKSAFAGRIAYNEINNIPADSRVITDFLCTLLSFLPKQALTRLAFLHKLLISLLEVRNLIHSA